MKKMSGFAFLRATIHGRHKRWAFTDAAKLAWSSDRVGGDERIVVADYKALQSLVYGRRAERGRKPFTVVEQEGGMVTFLCVVCVFIL